MSIFGKIVSAIMAPLHGRAMTQDEVEAQLIAAAAMRRDQLDWRVSIVDLLTLLEMDSSLSARKELAEELGYEGKYDGSVASNVWLRDMVMHELAERYLGVPGQSNAR